MHDNNACNIVTNRSIKNKDVLLNYGNNIMQRFVADALHFIPIISDFPGVISVTCYEQIQKRRFSTARCANDSVFLTCAKYKIDVVQNVAIFWMQSVPAIHE